MILSALVALFLLTSVALAQGGFNGPCRCTNDLFLGSQGKGKMFTTGGDSIPLTTQ
jgi:hypothetical protein